jgi:DNA polymerase-3 subunit delta
LLYILYGEDDFSRNEELTELKKEAEANIIVLEGQKLSPNKLITTCDTIPFLAPKRLVIVEWLLSRFESKDKRRGSRYPELGEWQALQEYIPRMPPSTVLALVDGKISRDNPLLKELRLKAKVREFPLLKGTELHNWVLSRVKKRGENISPEALQVLINFVGGNLWILSSEIDKLCLYAQGQRIEKQDVQLLVSYAREANIFALIDAIIQKRIVAASQILHHLLDESAAAPYLLFMLTRQFRLLIRAKELATQQLSDAELATNLGLSERLLPRVIEQAEGYSLSQLNKIYHQLLNTDIAIKTGKMKGELALDLLVIELCQ